MTDETLQSKLAAGELAEIDVQFAALLARLAATDDPAMPRLFAELSHSLGNQHSCLDLDGMADTDALIAALSTLPIVGSGAANRPLVLDGTRLYLQRYYAYETRIAMSLIRRNRALTAFSPNEIEVALRAAFGPDRDDPWQSLAVLQSLTRGLTIITGGPGTGKTSTIVRILNALLAGPRDAAPAIGLAAPTGKAAMRLEEAIRGSALPSPVDVKTVHRLLGMRADGRSYRYGPGNPLALDILIADEVSMVDLAMMDRLLAALPDEARLILVGDPNQLPSVETGNILGDICKYTAGYTAAFTREAHDILGIDLPVSGDGHRLANAVCRLQRNYRFAPERSIGRLAGAIRDNRDIETKDDDDVRFMGLKAFDALPLDTLYGDYVDQLATGGDGNALSRAFDKTRILTPLREGDHGVDAINDLVEHRLEALGLIDRSRRYYHGRPVLITRNDYNLRLFNGDIGICVEGDDDEEPRVLFRRQDGELAAWLASKLPPHETCFAMTVHKSQGSEFDHVILVLPGAASEQAARIMTRELVYTAVTRARRQVTLCFDGSTLSDCLARRSVRHSGLGEQFLTDSPPAGTSRQGQLDLFG